MLKLRVTCFVLLPLFPHLRRDCETTLPLTLMTREMAPPPSPARPAASPASRGGVALAAGGGDRTATEAVPALVPLATEVVGLATLVGNQG